MIWSIVEKKEMENCGTNMVFCHYREALGKDNVKLAVVESDDPLDFVKEEDVVICRFFDFKLSETLKRKGVKSTAENHSAYALVRDKGATSKFLRERGINVPLQVELSGVEEGKTYFVKPRYGSDSFGISTSNICHTKDDVENQCNRLKKEFGLEPIIEEFIEGRDCTCACCVPCGNELVAATIEVECEETGGIQTRECKVGFKEYCYAMEDSEEVESVAKKVFEALELKHHARIDFRKDKDGKVYVIDVNLMPGLGPIDHFAKCFMLTKNFSYVDTMKMIVLSALNE